MSYGIGLHFKHITSESEVLELMYNIQQEYENENNIRELLEVDQFSNFKDYKECRELGLVDDKHSQSYLFDYFLQHLFTFRFYYWQKYNLFAICYMSPNLPDHLKKYFDGFIYFQNSTDQDYDYEEWKILGDWVKPIIKEVESLTPLEVYKKLFNWKPDTHINEMYECYKKVLVYKSIEEALDIENAIGLNKSNIYKYFIITKSFKYNNYKLSRKIISYYDKMYQNLEKNKK